MKNGKLSKALIMLFAVLLITANTAYAGHGSQCGAGQGGSGCDKKYECPVTAKFFMKANFFMENKEELGLSDDQVAKIKQLKLDVEKKYIQQMADMQIMMLDMDAKLSEPKVDVEGIGAMIDQGSAGMAASGKWMVQSYADLKGVLTDEQMNKAKSIWFAKKK